MSEYSVFDLRDMSASEAKELPEEEYARWRSVQETVEDAQATQARWRQEEREVGNVIVKAANDELHLPVDVFGNTIMVHAEMDYEMMVSLQELEDSFRGRGTNELSDAEFQRLREMMAELFRSLVVEFDGTPVAEIPEYTWRDRVRAAIVPGDSLTDPHTYLYEECLDAWRFSGMFKFIAKAAQTINAHQQEWEEQAKSFRRQERARDLRNP